MGLRGPGMSIQRCDPYPAHQGGHVLPADDDAAQPEQVPEHPAPSEGMLQMKLVQLAHQGQGGRQPRLGRLVDRRPGHGYELTLARDGQRVRLTDHRLPLASGSRPSAPVKKTRSPWPAGRSSHATP